MEIQIPSPSVFLKRSPVLATTVSTLVKKSTKQRGRPGIARTRLPPKANGLTAGASTRQIAVEKPKQSKSRNGQYTKSAVVQSNHAAQSEHNLCLTERRLYNMQEKKTEMRRDETNMYPMRKAKCGM